MRDRSLRSGCATSSSPTGNLTAQLAVLPAELARCLAECDTEFRAHAGSGVAQVSLEAAGAEAARTAVTRWRAIAANAHGHLRVLNVSSGAARRAADRILRSPEQRHVQVDAAAQGEFRSDEHLQPRMLCREQSDGRASTTSRPHQFATLSITSCSSTACIAGSASRRARPTSLTRAEMDSPRGRIYLMKSLAEGRLELDNDAVRHSDLCLGCRGCETACPSGVHTGN